MIIKLTGADASANNLGTVDVVNLELETVNLLRNMTKYSKYSNEALQINNVIASLKTAGIWNKIYMFYVPWMAANVDEIKYNLQGINLSPDVDNNLYYIDGDLYAESISGYWAKGENFKFPSYDVKGKFIAITGLTTGGFSYGIGNGENYILAVIQQSSSSSRRAGLGKTFNYNNIVGISGVELSTYGFVFNIDTNFSGVDASDLTTFTINNTSPSVIGTVSTGTETTLDRVMIANYESQGSDVKLTQNKNIIILGNTSLTSEEVITLKGILDNYGANI